MHQLSDDRFRIALRPAAHASGVLLLLGVHLTRPVAAAAQALRPGDLAAACYDLSLGPWGPVPLRGGDTIYIAPPSRVRFDTVRAERRRGDFMLSTAPGALPSVHRYAYWLPAATEDSVELVWSTGFSGLRMTIGGTREELRGQASAFWDFPRQPLIADAVARRVSCDAPAHPSAAEQRLVLRAVPLEGGDSVAVGMPLAAIRPLADSLRGHTFRMRRAAAGAFAGATTVDVSVNRRDTVWRVMVDYPADTAFESLVARLSGPLGPPVSSDTLRLPASGEAVRLWAMWSNRTTQLAVHGRPMLGGSWRTSVIITDYRTGP